MDEKYILMIIGILIGIIILLGGIVAISILGNEDSSNINNNNSTNDSTNVFDIINNEGKNVKNKQNTPNNTEPTSNKENGNSPSKSDQPVKTNQYANDPEYDDNPYAQHPDFGKVGPEYPVSQNNPDGYIQELGA